MFESKISVIGGHNKDGNTDHLYDPLRKTFLEDTTAKKTFLDNQSRYSHLSHLTRIHNYNQNHQLGERTLILEDRRLYRKHNVTQFPDSNRYYIINAEQRQLPPINQQELQMRLKQCPPEEEKILYTYGNEESEESVFEGPVRRKGSKLKVTQPKYNLFSMLDEGCNNTISGRSCTCPGNQVIASNKNERVWDISQQD